MRYLETNVRSTADGRCVAFHDERLDRVTDARGPLSAHTWAKLTRVRVHGGGHVPLLAELLETFPDANFTVDVKDARAIVPLAGVPVFHRGGSRPATGCAGECWSGPSTSPR